MQVSARWNHLCIQYTVFCLKDNFKAMTNFYHIFHTSLILLLVSHDLRYRKLLINQKKFLNTFFYQRIHIFGYLALKMHYRLNEQL